jgi:hypothetical protein
MVLIDPSGEPWRLVRDWLRGRRYGGAGRSTLGSVTELARSRMSGAPSGTGSTSASEEKT